MFYLLETVMIAISVAGPFIGWSNELHYLNIFLILQRFENKRNNEFNEKSFFSAVSAEIVHFQLPNLVYLRVVCV